MRKKDVEAFLDRPWSLFGVSRARRQSHLTPAQSLRLAETLRQSAGELVRPDARALGRALDWEHHLHLKALLERTGAARRP